jgi:hypothetical protein
MEVLAGKIWADNDKRAKGRQLRVLSVGCEFAERIVIRDRDTPTVLRGRYNVRRPDDWSAVGFIT